MLERNIVLVLCGALVTSVVFFAFVFDVSTEYRKAVAARDGEVRLNSSYALQVQRLTDLLGYGGAIHNFKNYIIRREERFRITSEKQFREAAAILEELRAQAPVGQQVISHINDIQETIQTYLSKILIASDGVRNNLSIGEVDRIVAVDDASALKGIESIARFFKSQTDLKTKETENLLSHVGLEIELGYYLVIIVWFIAILISFLLYRQNNAAKLLAREREKALVGERIKTEFLANMSHELRTPINAITGLMSLLLDEKPSARVSQYAEKARKSALKLGTLLDEVLDIARLRAGRITIEDVGFSPSEILDSACSAFQADLELKGVSLATSLDPDLPELVSTDPQRLRQIWVNLIGNAVKFTAKGTIDVSLGFSEVSDREGSLILAVSDTGPGIAADRLDIIFDDFAQADGSASRPFDGAGLGLAICRRLTEELGGRLSADSEPEKGSTFSVVIPCQVERRQEPRLPESPSGDPATLDNKVLLIAEDNKLLAKIAFAKLKGFFGEVIVVHTAKEALETVHDKEIDLVLINAGLRDVDGLAFTRTLRQSGREGANTAVIGISNDIVARRPEDCLAAGMNEVIQEPLDPAEFLARARSVIQQA
ncbi:MAG: ATP-binding protein [Magnetovibrionaceae bacterium]